MVGIVDYGMGNLMSVYNAFQFIGANVKICKNPKELDSVDRIVIPGVGAAEQCILRLINTGFADSLEKEVIIRSKPTLGICLGMQVMASVSYENGTHQCLGWFDGEVVKLRPRDTKMKVPNIGWNQIAYVETNPLFKGLPPYPDVYLVHSYQMKTTNLEDVVATYEYGETVTAAIMKNNIFATQFHPEKSQDIGLRILENFINWNP